MDTVTLDTLAFAALFVGSGVVTFLLGHAVGYVRCEAVWKRREVRRRHPSSGNFRVTPKG